MQLFSNHRPGVLLIKSDNIMGIQLVKVLDQSPIDSIAGRCCCFLFTNGPLSSSSSSTTISNLSLRLTYILLPRTIVGDCSIDAFDHDQSGLTLHLVGHAALIYQNNV